MIDLLEELGKVTFTLDAAGVPYALVGGLAYSILVEVRATEDIDLLVFPEDWERMPGLLEPLGYWHLAAPMDFQSIRIRRLTKILEGDTLMLDFLLADESQYREGIQRALVTDFMGHTLRVAPAEAIIALKRGRMSAKDIADIEGFRRQQEKES